MARTPYSDPDSEKAYQKTVAQSSKPSAYISDAAPQASFGGKSLVEINNPDLGGPSDKELKSRTDEFERQRRRHRGD